MSHLIADLVFPEVKQTVDYYEDHYPKRYGAEGNIQTCVRFAPSPTGYMHIGGLYTSLINRMFANVHDGVFLLRIEDTDQKRQLEDGVREITETLSRFQIDFDEGVLSTTEDKGNYGPYQQSKRKEIYHTYAKHLLEQGKAYVCFCTEEEIQAIRDKQFAAESTVVGYSEEWAACRFLAEDVIEQKLRAGIPYVIRLKSQGRQGTARVYRDELRGDIQMQENNQDIVIIKGDGLPTYHFAHAVDDHLMRVSDVIRADEWLSSLPLHIELFETLEFELPKYYHLSPIAKMEGTSKRKLSKRKDPEARVSYYNEVGYPIRGVLDYLMFISNSNYEDWWTENSMAPITDFPFDIQKCGVSSSLFDFDKLNFFARKRIGQMTEDEIMAELERWVTSGIDTDETLKGRTAMKVLLEEKREKLQTSIPIWHEGRLDVEKWNDLLENYSFLFDDNFADAPFELSEGILQKKDEVREILRAYIDIYNDQVDSKEWFETVKQLAERFNYCIKMKEYKKNPELYNGSIADFSTYIRLAVTHQTNSPDLFSILQFIGKEETIRRLNTMIERLN